MKTIYDIISFWTNVTASLGNVLTKFNFKTYLKKYERCHGNQFRQFSKCGLNIEIHNIVIFL